MLTQSANFLGVGVDAITYSQMEALADKWLSVKSGRSHHIACINAYCVTLALWDDRLRTIYNSADLRGADGVPFVWWIRKVLNAPCDRIAAVDTIWHLVGAAKRKRYTFYLYGGAPEIVREMRRRLELDFPHVDVVGHYSPPFRPLTEDEDRELCAELNSLKPDFILVGLGTPKQDYWIDEHLCRIHGSVFIACGASFDFLGGRVKLAPAWIRQSGFEWLYRLFSRDFRRLWKRYTVYNLVFMWTFFLQITGIKVRDAVHTPRPE